MILRALEGWPVIEAEGSEFPDLLHRLSTNAVLPLQAGDARETILTTEKGRIIDVVIALGGTGVTRVLASPGRRGTLRAWFERYTIMEDIRYRDTDDAHAQWEFCATTGEDLEDLPIPLPGLWEWMDARIGAVPALVVRHRSICAPGVRLLFPADRKNEAAAHLLDAAAGNGIPVLSREEFDLWRVRRGFPAVGYELTEKTNPLEAGAESAVSFTKGCYIGQEVIARLDSYEKVQRHLRALSFDTLLPDVVDPGTPLTRGGRNAGFLTTVVNDFERGHAIALGCIRVGDDSEGTELTTGIGGTEFRGTVRPLQRSARAS